MGLFDYFKRKKIQDYITRAEDYVKEMYIEPEIAPVEEKGIEYSSEISPPKKEKTEKTESKSSDIKYSIIVGPDDHIRYSDRNTGEPSKTQYEIPTPEITKLFRAGPEWYKAPDVDENLLKFLDQSFSGKVRRYIRDKGLSDTSVYKAAQLDRRLFSKMMTDRNYNPSKDTAVAVAAALKLTAEEAENLLQSAGYTFSRSSRRDVILDFSFINKIYSLNDINAILVELKEKPLGRIDK